jgi:uncharacterized protein
MQPEAVVDTVRRRVPGCVAIYLFGSRARGAARHDSDVDLAILGPAPLGEKERWNLAQDLALELGQDVDLVDLLRASTVMRVQVIDSGKLLFESDSTQRREFEAVALWRVCAAERGAARDPRRHSRAR